MGKSLRWALTLFFWAVLVRILCHWHTVQTVSQWYFPGMAGMEPLVVQGAAEANPTLPSVRVVDGAKAGVELLAGLVRFSS